MTVIPFWQQIIDRGWVESADGTRYPLHSSTSGEQCRYLQEQMRSVSAVRTLEVGLAYGLSTLAICEQLRENSGAQHIVIDPWQKTECWHGVGLENLSRAGLLPLVQFHEVAAEVCLPQLLTEGVKIDFAYIDAGKRLDDTLIYSWYVMRMLRVGGRVVFDDAQFPGVRTALRYLVQDSRYRAAGCLVPDGLSMSRRVAESVLRCLPWASRLVSREVLQSDRELGIAANCVVLEKVGDGQADWKWHPQF